MIQDTTILIQATAIRIQNIINTVQAFTHIFDLNRIFTTFFNHIVMLALNLAPIFKARGIDKPAAFLVKAGFSKHIASDLANNKIKSLSFKHVETLCIVLFCEINDLFLFTPDKDHQLPDNHPMQAFTNQETVKKNYQDIFSTMSFKQLKEITKTLADKTEQ